MSCVNQDMPAPVMALVRELGEGFGDLDSILSVVIIKFGPLNTLVALVHSIIIINTNYMYLPILCRVNIPLRNVIV